jgi:hypothetical protein
MSSDIRSQSSLTRGGTGINMWHQQPESSEPRKPKPHSRCTYLACERLFNFQYSNSNCFQRALTTLRRQHRYQNNKALKNMPTKACSFLHCTHSLPPLSFRFQRQQPALHQLFSGSLAPVRHLPRLRRQLCFHSR